METLVDRIKAIELVPNYVAVDKQQEMREEFEEWRKRKKLVDDVIRGETTFDQEYQQQFGKYDGIQPFLPHTIPKQFFKENEEVLQCLGSFYYKGDFLSLIANPTIWSGLGVVMGIKYGYRNKDALNEKKISRRKFIGEMAGSAVILGFSLGIAGYPSLATFQELRELHTNAVYLDQKVKELYHS